MRASSGLERRNFSRVFGVRGDSIDPSLGFSSFIKVLECIISSTSLQVNGTVLLVFTVRTPFANVC